MKIESREFNIANNVRPKVLLLGNGINRAFQGDSWDEVLDTVKDKEKFPQDAEDYVLPMPLKATLLTNDNYSEQLKKSKLNLSDAKYYNENESALISELIDGHFDYVITTNYTYEIEYSLLGKYVVNDNISKYFDHYYKENAEKKYTLHSFNNIPYRNTKTPIFHVHGESRKPSGMILNHYSYGKLLHRYEEWLDKDICNYKKIIKSDKYCAINSWIDAFILGDIYIVGFSFDTSEFDLWWLLNMKSRLGELSGKTIMYQPIEYDDSKQTSNIAKIKLLELFNVEIRDLEYRINSDNDYKPFYNLASNDIHRTISNIN